jgi:hypothetical protein
MDYDLSQRCDTHESRYACPDALIDVVQERYGLIVHDGGSSVIEIKFCPWCGARFASEEMDRQDEPSWFRYLADLRIFGAISDLDELTRNLGLAPTHSHRRGDRRTPVSDPYQHDMWAYRAPVSREHSLGEHIDVLWGAICPHKDYLLGLKENLTVDVFLGYRSNSDTAGVEVPSESLEMFTALQIPFGLSIIIS